MRCPVTGARIGPESVVTVLAQVSVDHDLGVYLKLRLRDTTPAVITGGGIGGVVDVVRVELAQTATVGKMDRNARPNAGPLSQHGLDP